jgi:hypothetical protein
MYRSYAPKHHMVPTFAYHPGAHFLLTILAPTFPAIPVPEFIDPVFVKTIDRFVLVFAKRGL